MKVRRYLAWKLGLGVAGAAAALGGERVGAPWLFAPGLGLVLLALLLPAYRGQTLREKIDAWARHLPGARWLRR
ncbi:MAG: hypothetical protein HY702_02340 [Gemmatimonadetes bacterium]|nr:hypothetical protein [Gemmatimonadota bacterium]